MPDKSKLNRKFRISITESFGFHIGLGFNVEPKDVFGKRDIYLIIFIGKRDLSIGLITEYDDEEGYDDEC